MVIDYLDIGVKKQVARNTLVQYKLMDLLKGRVTDEFCCHGHMNCYNSY